MQGDLYLALLQVDIDLLLRKAHCYFGPKRKLYKFKRGIVSGLVWSNDPEGYAGGNVATGRASHVEQVKGDDPDKKGYPSSAGWGVGVRLTTALHKKCLLRSF